MHGTHSVYTSYTTPLSVISIYPGLVSVWFCKLALGKCLIGSRACRPGDMRSARFSLPLIDCVVCTPVLFGCCIVSYFKKAFYIFVCITWYDSKFVYITFTKFDMFQLLLTVVIPVKIPVYLASTLLYPIFRCGILRPVVPGLLCILHSRRPCRVSGAFGTLELFYGPLVDPSGSTNHFPHWTFSAWC